MANGLANNFWIVPILFQYLGAFSHYCLTTGIFAKAGWMAQTLVVNSWDGMTLMVENAR